MKNYIRRISWRSIVVVFLFSIYLPNLFAAGSKDRTALYNELIKNGSAYQIREQLVKDNQFVNSFDGVTADNLLMQAIALGRDIDVINTLLYARISPTDVNNEGQTAVMYACAYGKDESTVATVITSGAITNNTVKRRLFRTDKNGYSAVDYAYSMNNTAAINAIRPYLDEEIIVKYEGGKRSEQQSQIQEEMSLLVAEKEEYVATEQTTESEPSQESGSIVFPAAIISPTITYDAYQNEEDDSIQNEGLEPNTNSPFDLIADSARVGSQSTMRLSSSTRTYLYDGVELIDDEQSNVAPTDSLTFIQNANEANERGQTKLMQAVMAGDIKLVSNLLFSGASVNERDNEGWTALMYAARYQNDSRITQSLLAAGADVTIKNDYALTALSLAATYSKNENIISLLLAPHRVADQNVVQSLVYSLTTPSGKSIPLQIRVAELFLNKGVDVNTFWNGKTLLMYAASSAHTTDMIAMLLARGARKDIYSSEGKSAFYYAQNNGNLPRDEVYWSLNSNN